MWVLTLLYTGSLMRSLPRVLQTLMSRESLGTSAERVRLGGGGSRQQWQGQQSRGSSSGRLSSSSSGGARGGGDNCPNAVMRLHICN